MANQVVDFRPKAQGGDDGTGALIKLNENCIELDERTTGLESRSLSAFENLLINGDLRVNQLVFPGGNLGANAYGYDGWRTFAAAASLTASGDGQTIALTGTAGQVIEAPRLANATVTVSLSNPSGPVTVKLQPDGTTATTATGVIPAGAGWQSVTLAVPATLTGNAYLLLSTVGAVTFDGEARRAGVMVNVGGTRVPFQRRPIAEEVLLAQRYYWKSFRDSVAPANASGSLVGAISYVIPGGGGGITYNAVRVPFPVKMRVPPALTFFNPLGPSVNWINTNLNANSGPVSIGTTGISESATVLVNLQVAGDQPPHTICVHMIADARL